MSAFSSRRQRQPRGVMVGPPSSERIEEWISSSASAGNVVRGNMNGETDVFIASLL